MKRLALLVLALSLQAATSRAQSSDGTRLEVAAGYSFFYIIKGFTIATNGVSGSVAFNANDWLGFVGDAGVYHGSPGGVGLTAETYTFGPRFSYRKAHRIVPFAHALFGGSHFSTDFSGNNTAGSHFAFSLGGGTDIALGRSANFVLRPQLEYWGIRANGSNVNNVRFSFGFVYRFGGRFPTARSHG